jgi:hypothetical protein
VTSYCHSNSVSAAKYDSKRIMISPAEEGSIPSPACTGTKYPDVMKYMDHAVYQDLMVRIRRAEKFNAVEKLSAQDISLYRQFKFDTYKGPSHLPKKKPDAPRRLSGGVQKAPGKAPSANSRRSQEKKKELSDEVSSGPGALRAYHFIGGPSFLGP